MRYVALLAILVAIVSVPALIFTVVVADESPVEFAEEWYGAWNRYDLGVICEGTGEPILIEMGALADAKDVKATKTETAEQVAHRLSLEGCASSLAFRAATSGAPVLPLGFSEPSAKEYAKDRSAEARAVGKLDHHKRLVIVRLPDKVKLYLVVQRDSEGAWKVVQAA